MENNDVEVVVVDVARLFTVDVVAGSTIDSWSDGEAVASSFLGLPALAEVEDSVVVAIEDVVAVTGALELLLL